MKILRAVAVVVLCAASVVSVVAGGPSAGAGTRGDYPEFPYPPTGYDEPYRGQFHFSARAGWLNDPNGSFYYRGQYHLFFQHNPHGLAWDTMHWGHAVSTDLVHWTQKPVALEPGVHAGDLWSGNGIVDTGNVTGLKSGADDPILLFSGTGGVTVHYSLDGARTFQSLGRELIDTGDVESRDPKVFWHEPSRRWVLVLYSDEGGRGANFYTSANLLDWEFRSRFTADWMFECPDMFQLPVDGNPGDRRWVLSAAHDNSYVLGDFDGTRFTATTQVKRMDHGGGRATSPFYAAQTFLGDPAGRVVQTAWQGGNHGSTWTGNLTFPAQLGLTSFADGIHLTREPVTELASLRGETHAVGEQTLTPGTNPLAAVRGDTYELTAEFDLNGATATRFGFRLHTRPGTHDREVAYDRAAGTLYGAPFTPVNNRVRMRLLVDRGQLEIFGDRFSFSDNVNFSSAKEGVELFTEGGAVRLVSARFTALGRAWGTGESTLDSNAAGPWHPVNGTWTDTAAGKQGNAAGDAFYLSATTAGDVTYEGDVRLDNGTAAGLTIRATDTTHYTANIDATGMIKLWRPGRDIATHSMPVTRGRTYHLKVAATGPRFRVYVDHATQPVIDATDTAYASGQVGANVYAGTATFDNLQVNAPGFTTNLTGPWHPVNGTWTSPGTTLESRGTADTFYLSETPGADFTYSGDVRPVNGVAAGLTFRANADATAHYTANVDTTGMVKLWRPGHDIAVHRTPITPGRIYRLTVTAEGPAIRVFLDGAEVITATDSTYATGLFGLNGFDGTASFRNVHVS